MAAEMQINTYRDNPDEEGHFGIFGGRYVAETLMPLILDLEKAYEENQSINGKITSKCKGGVIVEHLETGSLMFCPGSQISDKPLKDISHLMNEPQKIALIKLDNVRGPWHPNL